jgi:hypothetical protein
MEQPRAIGAGLFLARFPAARRVAENSLENKNESHHTSFMAQLLALSPAFAAASPAARPQPPAGRLRDWLSTQSAVVELWLERLVADGGDPRLIAVLDQHAAFLREAAEL